MEWLDALRARLVQLGVPERAIFWAGLPICLLLTYFVVYEAVHGLGAGHVWAHAFSLFSLVAFPWPFVCGYLLRDAKVNQIALVSFGGLVVIGIPFLWDIHEGSGSIIPFLASGVVLSGLIETLLYRPHWTRRAVQLFGTIFLASATLSLPGLVKWLELPARTGLNKVGVLVSRFELDTTGGIQSGVVGGLAREFKSDDNLSKIIELKQLQQTIRREPEDTFGEKRLRRALELGRNNKASIVVFGSAALRPLPAVDIIIAAVVPGIIDKEHWDIAIDTNTDIGIKLIHFLARVIGGLTYAVLEDCVMAEQLFKDAIAQIDVSPQTMALRDNVRLWQARSVVCGAARGQATVARIADAIAAYEGVAAGPDAKLRTLSSIGLGVAYRTMSQYGDLVSNLEKAIAAYNNAFGAVPPGIDQTVLALARSGLGVAHEKLGLVKDTSSNLHRALQEHERALALLPADDPNDYRPNLLNNRGVALMKLGESGEDGVNNFREAIRVFSEGLSSRHSPWSEDKSFYALMKSNLGDAYVDLSLIENKLANLTRAVKELEEGLQMVSAADEPAVFAETIFKLGVANMLRSSVRRGDNVFLVGLGQVTCSLVLLDSIKHNNARTAAAYLEGLGQQAGAQKLQEFLRSAPRPQGCSYRAEQIPALVEKWRAKRKS